MEKIQVIIQAIRQIAGTEESINEEAHIFNTTQAKFEDVRELLDILNIQYEEDWDCCISELYFKIDNKLIIVGYTHDFEW